MQNRPRNLSKMDMESHQKSLQNRPQNCRKFNEIDLRGCLGALWGPSWRQDGARATTRAKTTEIYDFRVALKVQNGTKIEQKSDKKSN